MILLFWLCPLVAAVVLPIVAGYTLGGGDSVNGAGSTADNPIRFTDLLGFGMLLAASNWALLVVAVLSAIIHRPPRNTSAVTAAAAFAGIPLFILVVLVSLEVPGDFGSTAPDAGQASGVIVGLIAYFASPIALVLWLVGFIGGSIIARAST